ncbi:MAG: ABC transporter permease [Clostridia bacterium]|nr:ABC transporter permease [Clostridia bacterium]
MVKYILQRILLMLFVFAVIMVLCFLLIKALPLGDPGPGEAGEIVKRRWEMLGYYKPVWEQLGILVKNVFTKWNWGVSTSIDKWAPATEVVSDRLAPTILINIYSLVFSVPIGIVLGIFAALKKNKWQDQVISTGVMLFISVPSFVYAFLVQYIFAFKLNWLPPIAASLKEAGYNWFSPVMTKSFLLAVMSLSFGTIAGLTRSTRAELTEALTSDYMLLARTKGLTRAQAIWRHALKNAMVPILPGIISSFVGILGGSFIIEQIFAVPGVGRLYITALTLRDYDVFIYITAFYTFIGLAAGILIDLSYGFLDPRVRMGSRK